MTTRFLTILSTCLLLSLFTVASVFAQETTSPADTGENTDAITAVEKIKEDIYEAVVIRVLEESVRTEFGQALFFQKVEIKFTTGDLSGQTMLIENGNQPVSQTNKYKPRDKVVVTKSPGFEGEDDLYIITDYVRRGSLVYLALIFTILAVIIGGRWGIASLLGMAISFLVVLYYILPQISSGTNPVFVAITGSMVIIPVTFYLSHGLNRKTHIAIIATVIALIITGLLARLFIEASHLTGFASEEATFLSFAYGGNINIKGLLLAGIIISNLGVLDDVTVSQAAIVFELKKANPKLSIDKLYSGALKIGRDHISSMINTLILVYAGASLPLLLLFVDSPYTFSQAVNFEIIAEEIIRTLVGSIGLILSVPIATLIAAKSANKKS